MPNNVPGWIWWVFSAIFVGIVINIVSAYLKTRSDNFLAKRVESKRREKAHKDAEFEAAVGNLLLNPNASVLLRIREAKDWIAFLISSGFGIISLVLGFSLAGHSFMHTIEPSEFRILQILSTAGLGIFAFSSINFAVYYANRTFYTLALMNFPL